MPNIFPFPGHRSMAEVAETEALLKRSSAPDTGFYEWRRLDVLLLKAEVNNPPPVADEPDSVA